MAKLSGPQSVALVGLSLHGMAHGAKPNTIDSLVNRGLIEIQDGLYVVNEDGRQAYRATTGSDLPVPAPVVEFQEALVPVVAPVEFDPAIEVGDPEDVRRPSHHLDHDRQEITHWNRPSSEVQAVIKAYRKRGLTADEIDQELDRWHLKANRSDRRAQRHARKVANRLDMRQAKTPKRPKKNRRISPPAFALKHNRRATDRAFAENRADWMAENGVL